MGSLNYYSRFIRDFAIYASVLYELRETNFFEISQMEVGDTISTQSIKEDRDPDTEESKERDPPNERTRWKKATIAFTMLKANTATTPILKHFDPDRIPLIVVYAIKWAVSASLLQEYGGV